MAIKTNYQCIRIETNDNREFFTEEENYPLLVEYAKTFSATMSTVIVEKANILSLSKLAQLLCDNNYQKQKVSFKTIQKSNKSINKQRTKILSNAKKIRNYILTLFLNEEIVDLHTIYKKFHKHNLSLSCICNHISKTRKKLQKEGYAIKKLGAGKYKLIN